MLALLTIALPGTLLVKWSLPAVSPRSTPPGPLIPVDASVPLGFRPSEIDWPPSRGRYLAEYVRVLEPPRTGAKTVEDILQIWEQIRVKGDYDTYVQDNNVQTALGERDAVKFTYAGFPGVVSGDDKYAHLFWRDAETGIVRIDRINATETVDRNALIGMLRTMKRSSGKQDGPAAGAPFLCNGLLLRPTRKTRLDGFEATSSDQPFGYTYTYKHDPLPSRFVPAYTIQERRTESYRDVVQQLNEPWAYRPEYGATLTSTPISFQGAEGAVFRVVHHYPVLSGSGEMPQDILVLDDRGMGLKIELNWADGTSQATLMTLLKTLKQSE